MPDNWVVVADRARCRIFSQATRHGPLEELEVLTSPRARLKDQDVNADRAGRSFDSGGHGRHAMGPPVSPYEQDAIRFSKGIAERLESARNGHRYAQLILVAEPRFLGLLRSAFGRALRDTVAAEVDKELTEQDPEAIRQRLRELLFER
jgi:protein required for attachment to host cells